MRYHNMSNKQNATQLDWQVETNALKLLQNYEIGYLEYMSASLFAVLFKGVARFTRWFTTDSETLSYQNAFAETTVALPERVRTNLRMNSQGVEIIKRFEHFPFDVEPDVREAERIVRRLVKVPLTSNQFSALVSFTFSVGEATLRQSDLLKYLNAKRYKAAAKEFKFWVYIGSTRFSKLAARRVAEQGLFLKAD
jgi:hypothetical protein